MILDEPTAALGLRESARVLDLVRRLKDDGVAVILISHSMDHVMAVADRAVVMRRGRTVGEAVPTAENHDSSCRGSSAPSAAEPCDRPTSVVTTRGLHQPTPTKERSTMRSRHTALAAGWGPRPCSPPSCGSSDDSGSDDQRRPDDDGRRRDRRPGGDDRRAPAQPRR